MEDKGITDELIQELSTNILLVLNITEPEEPDNPTSAQEAEYQVELNKYTRTIQLLNLYINAICNNILIKTNRKTFIDDLKYIVIDLVVDKYNNNIKSVEKDINSVQSMSEAGRSVNFGVSSVLQNKLNLLAKKQIEENESLINKYKLLYKA